MENIKFLLVISLAFIAACSSSASLNDQIQQLETSFANLSNPETGLLDQNAASQYLEAVDILVKDYPKDSAVALHLYRAAEVARASRKGPLAISYYERINRDFPGFNRLPEVNFMLAFTYDEDLKDLEKAKVAYESFIQNFPNHDFADDAQMLLKNLGKSDEEILRELESTMAPPATNNN